ncbi:MAG: hypothetical protein HQL32_07170 [Planctomycetes bacterium]|nr:hypothetical protein [Planctomycetota bacterium]
MPEQSTAPHLLALFEKRVEGDDALLEMARSRFEKNEIGAEVYAGSPEELRWLLSIQPKNTAPLVVHLPRYLNLLKDEHLETISLFIQAGEHWVYGYVLHDTKELESNPSSYYRALQKVQILLLDAGSTAMFFLEYAAGISIDSFADIFRKAEPLTQVSACVDTGHVGIRQVRKAFNAKNDTLDPCSLTVHSPELQNEAIYSLLEESTRTALPHLLTLLVELQSLGKPIHIHLHDGHPLSEYSPYGVSDHLGFFESFSLLSGSKELKLPTLYGPSGLKKIINALDGNVAKNVNSITLEFHPIVGRHRDLDEEDLVLFQHWDVLDNAKCMNEWLHNIERHVGLIKGFLA